MDSNELKSVGFGEFRTGWPVVMAALFGIGLGLSPVPFYSIGMLAPELAKEFGWKFGDIMVGLPIMVFGVLIASPAVGWLADRHGVRRVDEREEAEERPSGHNPSYCSFGSICPKEN